jgi:transcriptional regulator GlxA family with amidase domain
MVVYSSEVPVAASIIKASKEEPYLGLVFQFDPQRLSELVIKAFPHGVPKNPDMQPICVGKSNPKIVNSAIRLMELINLQEDLDLLVPLVIDEILIRLLRSPIGASIAQIGIVDSNAHKVAKAIYWLKDNYTNVMKVEDLAKRVGMSPSSFHQYFKSITSMSPLQYQKVLRLQEARHLMLSELMDVSTASLQVGYSSTSQFSREYSRFFGSSPAKDIARLREYPIT